MIRQCFWQFKNLYNFTAYCWEICCFKTFNYNCDFCWTCLCHCFSSYCWRLCFVQTEYSHIENGRYVYRIHRSPMCEYMINFILKLKQLPEKYMMNSVLENFTVLQVLLCFLTWFGNNVANIITLNTVHMSISFYDYIYTLLYICLYIYIFIFVVLIHSQWPFEIFQLIFPHRSSSFHCACDLSSAWPTHGMLNDA